MDKKHTTTIHNDQDKKEYVINTLVVDSYYGAVWTTEVFLKSSELYSKQESVAFFNVATDADGSVLVQLNIGDKKITRKWPHIEPEAFELLVMAFVKTSSKNEWTTFFNQFIPPVK